MIGLRDYDFKFSDENTFEGGTYSLKKNMAGKHFESELKKNKQRDSVIMKGLVQIGEKF